MRNAYKKKAAKKRLVLYETLDERQGSIANVHPFPSPKNKYYLFVISQLLFN